MNPMLRNFLAVLLGLVLWMTFDFALVPDEFDFAREAVRAIVFVIVCMVIMTVFNRLRARRKGGA